MPDLVFATKGTAEVIRQQTLINERAAELASIYKADANAAQDLERAAQRVFKNAQNPAKQFNEEMGRLLGHYKQGKINAEQYEKGVQKLTKTYEETQTISGKLRRSMSAMFGSDQVKQLATFAGGVASISTAVSLLKSEYAAALDLVEKASRTQLDVGQSRNLIIRNLPGSSQAQLKSVLGQSSALAGELRLPESSINQALAQSLSAAGGNVGTALGAVRAAGQFLPDQLGDLPQFAGALIDMSKVTGSSDPQVNLGYLNVLQKLARNVEAGSIARNAPSGLISATRFGATPQEAAALFATLGSFTGDVEGSSTSTALTQLSKQLSLGDVGGAAGAKTTGQRLAFLQNNPEAAQAFLAKASFEAKSVGQIRDLILNPQGEIAKAYASNLGQIPGQQGLAALAGQTLGSFNANALEPLAVVERGLQSINEQARVGSRLNLSEQGTSYLREALMRIGGTTSLGANFRQFVGQLGDGGVGVSIPEAEQILRGESQRLRRPTTTRVNTTFGPIDSTETPATPEAKRAADRLDELADLMAKQLEQQKETNRKLGNGGMIVGNQ